MMSEAIHKQLLCVSRGRFGALNKIFATNGVISLKKGSDDLLFEHLVRTVAGQQLSKQAANTIWGRVVNLSETNGLSIFNQCSQEYADSLKECGLSRFKVKAILGVKDAFLTGAIEPSKLSRADYKTVVDRITSLWGFGNWSADMIALFFFAHEDVWSPDDVALQRGMRFVEEQDSTSAEEVLKAVAPYRSYLSLHLWKAIDTNII